ncbi:hypothetical protein [Wolbachia endosymbiont (group A) of Colletes cunicularius]|uniref:hypothetical protein n=1 Tax=Wolbachia endosymbiont (group A) of Colletes cunicularius TaxID=3139321 RepID=UPI0035C8E814
MSFFLLGKFLKHLQRRLVAIKSSLISLVKRLKHKKRQYFKADNNHGASFAFFLFGKFLNIYSNMNWAGRCHSSAPFFVIPASRAGFNIISWTK